MQFKIDPRIVKSYPGVMVGVVVVHNCSNSQSPESIVKMLISEQLRRLEEANPDVLAHHPHLVIWRQAYSSFGAQPKDYLSSIDNMLKRIMQGHQIRPINSLVDLYNTISLRYLLPAGGEDLDTIEGDIVLTIAGDNEPAIILLGEKEARPPVPGEVIYRDDKGAICRRWNWKEASRTQLTEKTRNAILVIEALPPISPHLVSTALNDLAALVEYYTGGIVSIDILDEHHREITIKANGNYISLQPRTTIPEDIVVPLTNVASVEPRMEAEYAIRVVKVEELHKRGIEPWPHAEQVTATTKMVLTEYQDDDIERSYTIAGRLMSCRMHGKALFGNIQDQEGRLQIYVKQEVVGPELFELFKRFIDIGDIVWCQGYAFKTKTDEITLHVTHAKLLSKCLHPLPEKFHGLTDIEVRHRQRYLDLIMHEDVKKRFMQRSTIVRLLRTYLDNHDFLEVETPMLHPIPGGAAARPFITHHNALNADFYLRIAPELYLKRLVVGGFERVYEINRNFRNEGVSTRHNPEFYWAHRDYHFIMQFVESMIKEVLITICGTLHIPFGTYTLDFAAPFERLNIIQVLTKYGGFSEQDLTSSSIDGTLKKAAITVVHKEASYAQKLFTLFEETCEKKIIQPTFLVDYPIELSPLAKRDTHNPLVAARYELFIAGMEISNGFNELNDPFDQAERFKKQVQAYAAGDEEAHQFDADYITALEYGLPPTVGVGIGIDRLVMLLTNTLSIKDVILFPTLKRKHD